jgi:hypothetical protein
VWFASGDLLRRRCRQTLSLWKETPWTMTLLVVGTIGLVFVPLWSAIDSAFPGSITRRGNVWICDLKTLSSFDLDQVHGRTEDIPPEFRKLDGQRVELLGQMWVPYEADEGLRNFDLVYSVANCCFSGPPRVQHIVRAKMRHGTSVPYLRGKVDVTGTLHVGVQSDANGIQSVYRVDVDSVKPD